ncbi:MAG: leucine-rich repeat protein, partial [Clostridiales bacterium]|nr:leucine-rich repeat protein [Clostridiales bacterium]
EVCENCGDKQYTVLPPLGHDWDNGTIVYQATCAKNGYMYYTCDNCGETKSQILNATGDHSFTDGACEYCGIKYAVYIDEYYNNDYGYRYLATLSNGEDLCAFYDDIAEGVMAFHNDGTDAQYDGKRYVLCNIDYVKYGLAMDEAIAVWKTYLDDKPLYYWVSKNTVISAVSGLVLAVVDEYADGDVRTACNTELYGAIEQYVALASGENAYTVALAFHDKIIEAIDYAYDQNNKPESAAWAHNITGVLEGKGAVCEGYARTFQLLLNVRGINNLLVTGKNRTVDHAWNLAEIDGEWYWFDLTFDDTPDYYWGTSHDYFCATDDSFLKNHTPDNGDGLEFLYELPTRAQSRYDGDDAIFYDTFTHDGAEYVVVGYDTVDISRIDVEGEFAIPSTVSHRGREYSVVSIMKYEDGEESYMSTVPSVGVTSLHIPATVKYINDGALRGRSIETVTVDEDNPLFTAQDGVLFSKMKFVLIFIPYRINLKEYVIPDETVVIAKSAFSWFSFTNLEKLTVGKSVRWVGMANWGIGYPDDRVGGNIVLGEWNNMKLALCGAKQLLVHEGNPYFVIQDEMLFNKSMTILYAGLPNIVTAVIPETVTRIEYEPFSYCRQLVSVKVNDGIVTLPH